MNADIFSEWLKRQGYRVYRTESSYWYNAGPLVLQAFPYHWLINPRKEEVNSLMLNNPVVALRYSSPFSSDTGKVSYHIVQNRCYDITTINSKARNGVKRGLENFRIEKISFERLAKEGWYLQYDTLLRQNRQGSMQKTDWERLCLAARDLPGFEVFAALSGYDLAAAAIVCRIDNLYSVPFAMSHCKFLRQHVNNALFYSMICELLNRDNISGIFFTVQSLDAPANVDEFKIRMGFEPKLIRQNVVIHPFIRPFITRPVYELSRRLHEYYPSNHLLAKSEGMLRFHLEGRRPVKDQSYPDCLKEEMKLLENDTQFVQVI
jgi:hypothetical protein